MNIATRLCQPADLATVAVLFDQYRQFYEQPANEALALRFISERFERQESVILVAESGAGELVGFCQLYPTFCSVEAQPIYALYDLFVLPSARKCGAGRLMLQAAEALARAEGKAHGPHHGAQQSASAVAL